jgi:group I intron endonuclease
MDQQLGTRFYLPEGTDTACGIYMIRNVRNGKKYIGSTKNAKRREKEHFQQLSNGVHHCDHLQHAWNAEPDVSVFKFVMFIYCAEKILKTIEQGCFDTMKPEYNSSLTADRPEMTPLTRAKISASGKISQNKPETVAKKRASAKKVQKEAQNKPGVNERRSASCKRAHAEPVIKQKHITNTTVALARPDVKLRQKNGIKRAHERLSTKEKHRASLRACNLRPEAVERNRRNFSGARNPRARAVVELSSGKCFETIQEAAVYYGLTNKSISRVCLGQRKTAGPNKQRFAYLDAVDVLKVKTDD